MRVVQRVRGLIRSDDNKAARVEVKPAEPEQAKVDEAVAAVEREVLKVALQLPAVAGPRVRRAGARGVPDRAPIARCARRSRAIGGTGAAVSGPGWVETVAAQVTDERVRRGVHGLAVEPLRSGGIGDERYADAGPGPDAVETSPDARSRAIKGRLQRINPLEQPDEHARMFGELIALESYHRGLRERANGGQ